MSEEPRTRPGLLHRALSVAGGVAFLVVASITALLFFSDGAGPIGAAVLLTAVFVTARWFSRDAPSQRGWKARLKRGGLFALAALVGSPVLALAALFLLPHRNPEALGHAAAALTTLAPTAFGIGMLTGK